MSIYELFTSFFLMRKIFTCPHFVIIGSHQGTKGETAMNLQILTAMDAKFYPKGAIGNLLILYSAYN